MLLIQVFRRLLESLFVSVFSGKIHISHYAVGIVFYILTGTSLAHPYLTRLNNTGTVLDCRVTTSLQSFEGYSLIFAIQGCAVE